MALDNVEEAIMLYLVDTYGQETDWKKIAKFCAKTKNQQKNILLAWATDKKAALTAQKANLAVIKSTQEAIIDSEIANIVDMETNF